MKEIGTVNRGIAKVISEQGHNDLLMLVDAGFAIPKEVEVVNISLGENKPMVLEVFAELRKFYSVEKMIMANQTKETARPCLRRSPNRLAKTFRLKPSTMPN